MFLKETNPHEISLLIQSLKSSNTTDIFGISSKFVKIASLALENTLSLIFNQSLNEGVKIIPIHKGDSRYIVANYRPISLLPIFSKIFEKLMYSRVMDFVTKNEILIPNQYGFQKINLLN